MQYRTPALVTLVVIALALPAAAAEPTRLVLEPDDSTVAFSLDAALHTVHGTIPLESGEISFDPAGGPASGEIVLAGRQADTDNKRRDSKMHRDVLKSEEHPTIRFEPSSVSGTLPASGQGQLRLEGKVVLLGEDHPFTIPAEVTRTGDRVSATATFHIPYVAWGLHDPSGFLLKVGKEVEVTIAVAGSLEQ